jgi:spore coat polysaccharide biosynthesis predicted glycosyltransferase SpsG
MIIHFKCEASQRLGFGHLRRCLMLAEAFRAKGAACAFILPPGDATAIAMVRGADFGLRHDDEGCENLILDLFHHDNRADPAKLCAYLETVRGRKTIFIDGMFEDAFRDPRAPRLTAWVQPYPDAETDMRPPAEHWFAGGQYVILPPRYAGLAAKEIAPRARRLLLTFGGADPQGLTPFVMAAVAETDFDARVMVGPYFSAEHRAQIRAFGDRFEIIEGEADLLRHYLWADLAAGASSLSRLEFAAAGLPCVFAALYPYHERLSKTYAEDGAAQYLGRYEALDGQDWRGALCNLAQDAAARQDMSRAGQRLIDGRGADRLTDALLRLFS